MVAPGAATTAPGAAAVAAAPKPINPATAPDPFSLFPTPADKKRVHANLRRLTSAVLDLKGALLRGSLPPQELYSYTGDEIKLPAPPTTPGPLPPVIDQAANGQPASLPRVAGVIYQQDGVYAILQGSQGDEQSVKPGDSIAGVGRVLSIQSDSITVRSLTGSAITIPVTRRRGRPPPGASTPAACNPGGVQPPPGQNF